MISGLIEGDQSGRFTCRYFVDVGIVNRGLPTTAVAYQPMEIDVNSKPVGNSP